MPAAADDFELVLIGNLSPEHETEGERDTQAMAEAGVEARWQLTPTLKVTAGVDHRSILGVPDEGLNRAYVGAEVKLW